MLEENANILKVLEGSQLSSVEFVHDYIQLRFDGPCLTAITPPLVESLNGLFEWGSSEYRNVLCEQIGKLVRRAVTLTGKELRIEFENQVSFSISLKPDDYQAAEAAIFSNPPDAICVW